MAGWILEGQRRRGEAGRHPPTSGGSATAAPHEAEQESDNQEQSSCQAKTYADDCPSRKALLGLRRPGDLSGQAERNKGESKGIR